MIPLALILIFSTWLGHGIHLDVVTAMLIGAFIALVCETIRTRNPQAALKGFMAFFDGMGRMFADIISLIICTETFAMGLQTIGMVGFLINGAQGSGFGLIAMTLVMCAIVVVTAVITGSGNAAFFSFANLAPKIAGDFGIPAVAMLLPMQLCAGLGRAMSPVAGVIIAVSDAGRCSPLEIVRRTVIPVCGGLVVVLVCGVLIA